MNNIGSPNSQVNKWKRFYEKGEMLAKHIQKTEEINEYVNLISIRQEQYISASVYLNRKIDSSKDLCNLYYSWGRCIYNLLKFKHQKEKHQLLLMEEAKYKIALELIPNDFHIIFCWAVNLRFQLEFQEKELIIEKYK